MCLDVAVTLAMCHSKGGAASSTNLLVPLSSVLLSVCLIHLVSLILFIYGIYKQVYISDRKLNLPACIQVYTLALFAV